MNKITKNLSFLIVSFLIVFSIVYLEKHKPTHLAIDAKDVVVETQTPDVPLAPEVEKKHQISIVDKAKKYPKAKEFVDAKGFINSEPFKLSDVVGKKIVLIDFWTYSCINCQRTLPYLKMWNEKYKDKGLVIVGMHTPEFDFEKDYNNVLSATKKLGVTYPVVLDSDMGTWTAYNNQYWQREYLIDIDGSIVPDHIGEGDYDKSEKAIQDALKERTIVLGIKDNIDTTISKPSDAIAVNTFENISPETYFGSRRNSNLGNGKPYTIGEQMMVIPDSLKLSTIYLGGTWNFINEYAENTSTATIKYRFKSKNVYFVASSKNGVPVTIFLDGKPIEKPISGEDVALDGTVWVKENRLYDIVHEQDYGEHTLEIQIEKPGLDAYTFTFG